MSIWRKIFFLDRLLDRFFIAQLQAFFLWIQNTPNARHGTILVKLPYSTYHVDAERKLVDDFSELGFVICTPETRESAFTEATLTNRQPWQLVFATSSLEIWETTAHFTDSELPLRFRLSTSRQATLLSFARECLVESFASESEPVVKPEEITSEISDVDIALWVDGELRGSIVIAEQPILSGIRLATTLARVDSRFKPLAKDEIEKTIIEVTIISRLRLPITTRDIICNELFHNMTYRIDCAGQTGWYVPAVFNMLRFYNLKHLTTSLLQEKMGLPAHLGKDAKLTISPTYSICETAEKKPLLLDGPIPYPSTKNPTIARLVASSIDFLTKMQETDGNIRLSYNPLNKHFRTIDWTRLAFTYKALCLYGTKVSDNDVLAVATRAADFLLKHVTSDFHPDPTTKALTLTYLLQALASEEEIYAILRNRLETVMQEAPYNPITYSQFAQLALKESDIAKAQKYTLAVAEDYIRKISKNLPIDTASYIELIPLLSNLGQIQNKIEYTEQANKIRQWYLEQQLSSGGFRANQLSTFCYTRGTSKILEVLGGDQSVPVQAIERSIAWLGSFAYQADNTWYIPEDSFKKLEGGFRHDYFNPEAWIDTNAHLLCAFVSISDK